MLAYKMIEKGMLPDILIRYGIKRMLAQKLKEEASACVEEENRKLLEFVDSLKRQPIAIETGAANEQHYEVPAEFFELVLGPNMKYSCGLWESGIDSLEESENRMLELYCQRAKIENGQSILDLGCGWGSFSLYACKRFPNSKITAISNSRLQREMIEKRMQKMGITNLEIITADISEFDTEMKFDRIVSIEMFEHMKNYEALLSKVSSWMNPEGLLFIHIFTHLKYAYNYENTDGTDWLTEHFFTGGTMPSCDLLLYFQKDVAIEDYWRVNGTHYEKTSNAWLKKMDENKERIMPILEKTYGKGEVLKWWNYWRVFFMACAELWGYKDGSEWMVCHYLFSAKQEKSSSKDLATKLKVTYG